MATINRYDTIDYLRGFIMMAMALDHASAMIGRTHFTEVWGNAFSGYPDLAWWFTRFISHLCAPGFFFLMGISIVLFATKRQQKGWTSTQIRSYFLKRGGIILLLMIFVEFPAWGLNDFFGQIQDIGPPLPGQTAGGFFVPSTVLYGLGASMMVCSVLWSLEKHWYLVISVVSFLFSAWIIGQSEPDDTFNTFVAFFSIPARSEYGMTLYPLLPWLGVATFGMYWGKLLLAFPKKINHFFLYAGVALIGVFIGLRLLEIGNFQENTHHDWITFFTVIKYPPSVSFITITLGINFICFFLFSRLQQVAFLKPIQLFGQTAMFFYLLHLYIYALIGSFFPHGAAIEIMYVCWFLALIPLYYACQWFLHFKQQKAANSIWKMI